jgi:hypothetical protein
LGMRRMEGFPMRRLSRRSTEIFMARLAWPGPKRPGPS